MLSPKGEIGEFVVGERRRRACRIENCIGWILGIEAPWYVESVELNLGGHKIHVRLWHHDMNQWECQGFTASILHFKVISDC
jgi:hypothetical protein